MPVFILITKYNTYYNEQYSGNQTCQGQKYHHQIDDNTGTFVFYFWVGIMG